MTNEDFGHWNLGYVGSVLVPILDRRGYEVVGLDIGYFSDCCLCEPFWDYQRTSKDIRNISETTLSHLMS